MLLLQSIICLKGFDNRSRFLALSVSTYLVFIIFSMIFSNNFIISFVLLLLCTSLVALTTKRRLHDAKQSERLLLIPTALFFLTGLATLFITENSFYLLLLPMASSAFFLTYASNASTRKSTYIYGYYGPVDLSSYIEKSTQKTTRRIEPTLASQSVTSHQFDTVTTDIIDNKAEDYGSFTQAQNSTTEPATDSVMPVDNTDIGEKIRLVLLTNKKFQLAAALLSALVIITIIVINMTAGVDDNINNQNTDIESSEHTQNNNLHTEVTRSEPLVMPDNFTLYLSQYRGVIVHWQADDTSNGEIWSQLSAQGDKSCKAISFNNGDDIRPVQVNVENVNNYYAAFSPLDSKELIKALAFRGDFTLCGYKFSLKGSQAALGKNSLYGQYIDY